MLCDDGACIGVIGDDGTCPVCGRAARDPRQRELAAAPGPAAAIAADARAATAADPSAATVPASPAEVAPSDSDPWSDRRLCHNGACLGVIGQDGRCHVCGAAG